MSTQLLEIQPKELKFIFELKKHSSCSIRLVNNTHHYVAFKVKTTSPKRYCVRPNVGVILPRSISDFTVTMQPQRTAPPDMVCKDKFLIQSTIVPVGTTEEDIMPSMFIKDEGKYIEENKLRVTLISPPHSPVLSPINGSLKKGLSHEASKLTSQVLGGVETQHTVAKNVEESKLVDDEVIKPSKESEFKPAKYAELKVAKYAELKPAKDAELKVAKDTELKVAKDAELKPAKDTELKVAKDAELKPAKDTELKVAKAAELKPAEEVDLKPMKNVEELNLVKDIEEMKSKLNGLESKLREAEVTISKLTEERRSSIQDIKSLQEKLAELSRRGVRKVQVGFPLLFVCMVALVSVVLGYLLRP